MKVQFLDLEMLCWPDGSCPSDQTKHIIQIGLVEVESETKKITRERKYYIRPHNKNFEVSDYCTNLTGITKSVILNEGRYFPEVLNSIKNEFSPSSKVTFAWGSDYDPIATHCSHYDVSNPWVETGILDYGLIFRILYNPSKKLPLERALKFAGLKFEGTPHDALVDAKNLAYLYMDTRSKIEAQLSMDNKKT